jgi:hypothetical protein
MENKKFLTKNAKVLLDIRQNVVELLQEYILSNFVDNTTISLSADSFIENLNGERCHEVSIHEKDVILVSPSQSTNILDRNLPVDTLCRLIGDLQDFRSNEVFYLDKYDRSTYEGHLINKIEVNHQDGVLIIIGGPRDTFRIAIPIEKGIEFTNGDSILTDYLQDDEDLKISKY